DCPGMHMQQPFITVFDSQELPMTVLKTHPEYLVGVYLFLSLTCCATYPDSETDTNLLVVPRPSVLDHGSMQGEGVTSLISALPFLSSVPKRFRSMYPGSKNK